MNRLKKLFGLMGRLLAGEKPKTTIGDVLNRTVVEGWDSVRKQNRTPAEEKKFRVMSRNLDNIVQLMVTCADIEAKDPNLAKRLIRAI